MQTLFACFHPTSCLSSLTFNRFSYYTDLALDKWNEAQETVIIIKYYSPNQGQSGVNFNAGKYAISRR